MDKVVLPVRGDDSSTNLATSSRPTGTVKVPTRYNDFVQAQEGTSMTQSTFPPILLFPNSISASGKGGTSFREESDSYFKSML